MNKLLSSEASASQHPTFWLMSVGGGPGGRRRRLDRRSQHLQPWRHPAARRSHMAWPGQTFALVLGVLAVTNEFPFHRTVTSSCWCPEATRLLVARAMVIERLGLVLGLVASVRPRYGHTAPGRTAASLLSARPASAYGSSSVAPSPPR